MRVRPTNTDTVGKELPMTVIEGPNNVSILTEEVLLLDRTGLYLYLIKRFLETKYRLT